MRIRKLFAISLILPSLSALGHGQTALEVRKAELAIPFGRVEGQLFVVGPYLVFSDTGKPEHSFAVEKSQIKTLETEESVLKIVTRAPVADRTGRRSELVFKVEEPLELEDWLSQSVVPATAAATGSSKEPAARTGGG